MTRGWGESSWGSGWLLLVWRTVESDASITPSANDELLFRLLADYEESLSHSHFFIYYFWPIKQYLQTLNWQLAAVARPKLAGIMSPDIYASQQIPKKLDDFLKIYLYRNRKIREKKMKEIFFLQN